MERFLWWCVHLWSNWSEPKEEESVYHLQPSSGEPTSVHPLCSVGPATVVMLHKSGSCVS